MPSRGEIASEEYAANILDTLAHMGSLVAHLCQGGRGKEDAVFHDISTLIDAVSQRGQPDDSVSPEELRQLVADCLHLFLKHLDAKQAESN